MASFGQIASKGVLLAADAANLISLFSGPSWGIFSQSGKPVITGSVLGVAYRKSYHVADFPIERGTFASYNKVETPGETRVQFAVDGSAGLLSLLAGPVGATQNRHEALVAIEAACAVTDLFSVVTPEFTYATANLVHFDYERKARGSTSLLLIDVYCQEIRIAPSPAFASTKSPSATAPANGGTVQPQAPTAPQARAIPSTAVPAGVRPAYSPGLV